MTAAMETLAVDDPPCTACGADRSGCGIKKWLSPDPRVGDGVGRAVTCRCLSCVEDWSCDGPISNGNERASDRCEHLMT